MDPASQEKLKVSVVKAGIFISCPPKRTQTSQAAVGGSRLNLATPTLHTPQEVQSLVWCGGGLVQTLVCFPCRGKYPSEWKGRCFRGNKPPLGGHAALDVVTFLVGFRGGMDQRSRSSSKSCGLGCLLFPRPRQGCVPFTDGRPHRGGGWRCRSARTRARSPRSRSRRSCSGSHRSRGGRGRRSG